MALDELAPGRVTGWAAYPAGVAWALGEAGYEVPGAWLAFESDLPAGAGLSSSAALECATALALTELALAELALTELALTGPADRRELAVLASRAENECWLRASTAGGGPKASRPPGGSASGS